MSMPEGKPKDQPTHPEARNPRAAWPRRLPRFRLCHLVLAVLMFALLLALGRFTTWAYRDHQRRLGEQRKQLAERSQRLAIQEETQWVREHVRRNSTMTRIRRENKERLRRENRESDGSPPEPKKGPGSDIAHADPD